MDENYSWNEGEYCIFDIEGRVIEPGEICNLLEERIDLLEQIARTTKPTEYRILEEGEIIQSGDECEVSAKWNDEPRWVPATHEIGKPAPNPHYPAHRVYRRRV